MSRSHKKGLGKLPKPFNLMVGLAIFERATIALKVNLVPSQRYKTDNSFIAGHGSIGLSNAGGWNCFACFCRIVYSGRNDSLPTLLFGLYRMLRTC